MKNKKKGLLAAYGMVLPAFLVVMLTVAYPIVSAVIQSFQDENTGAFTTANYTYFFLRKKAQRKQPDLHTGSRVRNGCDRHRTCLSSGSVSAVCKIKDLQSHRYAVPAPAIRPYHVCSLCHDHDHP